MKNIEIKDVGEYQYKIKSDFTTLGRMYDNLAEEINVLVPEEERGNVCTMVVIAENKVIDHILVNNNPIPIKSNISQYPYIYIGFRFTRSDGYIKSSEVKRFSFLNAIQPDDFVPNNPEHLMSIDTLLGKGITDVKIEGTKLQFCNMQGELVTSVDLQELLNKNEGTSDDSLNEG